jgi:sugar lactone lactonase YvrE
MNENRGGVLRGALLAGAAVLAASGCGGGGSSGGGTAPTPAPPSGPQVYMTDISGSSSQSGPNTIIAFNASAILNGQTIAPTQEIQSQTFSSAAGIAIDGSGNIYIADQPTAAIQEFPPNVSGSNVAPTRSITSTNFLSAPYGIALGSGGNIYVTDPLGGPNGTGAVDVFSASQSGNVQPIRQITGAVSGLNQPYGIAVDGSGNIYVTNDSSGSSSFASVEEFSPSSAAPIRTIAGTATGLNAPIAIALDSSANLYVVNSNGNSVTVYGPGATGNAAPIRVIAGVATQIGNPQGVALDPAGNTWVTNLQPPGTPGSLNVFAAAVNGNVAPIALLSGNASVVFNPVGIAY